MPEKNVTHKNGSGGFFWAVEGDGVAEALQAADVGADNPLRVQSVQIVLAKVHVRAARFQHMINRRQQRMPHGDQRALFATAAHQAAEVRTEVRIRLAMVVC